MQTRSKGGRGEGEEKHETFIFTSLHVVTIYYCSRAQLEANFEKLKIQVVSNHKKKIDDDPEKAIYRDKEGRRGGGGWLLISVSLNERTEKIKEEGYGSLMMIWEMTRLNVTS